MQKPEYLCLTLPDAEATKEAERADSLSERPRSTTFRARLNLLSGRLGQIGSTGLLSRTTVLHCGFEIAYAVNSVVALTGTVRCKTFRNKRRMRSG